jgi:hypothetical protein
MTARQPRTPQEAAMLDPTGLMSFPTAPNQPRGIFGATTRRRAPFRLGIGGTGYAADDTGQPMDMTGPPPPISQAPAPMQNWKNVVGPDLMAQIPPIDPNASQGIGAGGGIDGDPAMTLPPSPHMRGGVLASNRGIFGSTPSAGVPDPMGGMSEKIGNRGTLPVLDANGKGKKGFDWRMLAGIVGDGLLGLNGQPGVYGPAMWKRRQDEANHAQRLQEMREQNRLKLAEPDYATINNRRVRIDPTTGESQVLYTAPQDFDDYAASLGAEPGTEAYDRLVQDYVLRGSGPTATDNYNIREDWRQENREELEGVRQNNRIGLQSHRQAGQRALKATPSYRQANPLPPRTGGRSGGGSRGGISEGATATGPGGAKVVYRGGKWMPAK